MIAVSRRTVSRTLSIGGSSGRPLSSGFRHAPAVHTKPSPVPQLWPSHSESRQSTKPSQSSSSPSLHALSLSPLGSHAGGGSGSGAVGMELVPPVFPPVPVGCAPPVDDGGRMPCPPVAGDSSRLPTTSSFEQPRIVPQHSQTTVPSLMLTSLVGEVANTRGTGHSQDQKLTSRPALGEIHDARPTRSRPVLVSSLYSFRTNATLASSTRPMRGPLPTERSAPALAAGRNV